MTRARRAGLAALLALLVSAFAGAAASAGPTADPITKITPQQPGAVVPLLNAFDRVVDLKLGNASLVSTFAELARAGQVTILLDPALRTRETTVTATLNRIRLGDALTIVCRNAGLRLQPHGGSLQVLPDPMARAPVPAAPGAETLSRPWLGWPEMTGLPLVPAGQTNYPHTFAGPVACPRCQAPMQPQWICCPNCGQQRLTTMAQGRFCWVCGRPFHGEGAHDLPAGRPEGNLAALLNAFDRVVEVKMANASVQGAFEDMARAGGIAIRLDPSVRLEDLKLNATFTGVRLGDVLSIVCQNTGLRLLPREGGLLVLPVPSVVVNPGPGGGPPVVQTIVSPWMGWAELTGLPLAPGGQTGYPRVAAGPVKCAHCGAPMQPQWIYCPECGQQRLPAAPQGRYCWGCGRAVDAGQTETPAPRTRSGDRPTHLEKIPLK